MNKNAKHIEALGGLMSLKMEQANKLTDEDISILVSQNQTQGRDTNYLVETQIINLKDEPKR